MSEYSTPEHEAWWAEREAAFRSRQEAQEMQHRIRAGTALDLKGGPEDEDCLLSRTAAGEPGADEALLAQMKRQARRPQRPRPSAQFDPQEWSEFFRRFYGRDMPRNAAFEAIRHRIAAAAPSDEKLAAAYWKSVDLSYDLAELLAERTGACWPLQLAAGDEDIRLPG